MNNLQWQFVDCNSKPLTNTKVLFTPTKSPEITSSYLSVADSYQFSSSLNGQISSSIVSEIYKVEIANPSPTTTFYISANETGSFLYSGSYQTGSSKYVYFDMVLLVKDPFAVKKVTLTPALVYPFVWNGSIVAMASTSSITSVTGSTYYDELIPGIYKVDCTGKVITTFYISVPISGSVWNAKDLLIIKPSKGIPVKVNNADNSYVLTVSSSDARYVQIGGTMVGTASWAANAVTSSYTYQAESASWAPVPTNVPSSSVSDTAISASHALESDHTISASWVPNLYPQTYQDSGSWASASISASYAQQALSASWAPDVDIFIDTGSFLNTGSLAQQVEDGWNINNGQFDMNLTQKFMNIVGNISLTGSGKLYGTASWASSSVSAAYAEQAVSASWAPTAGLTPGSTQPITASWSETSSVAVNAISASHALDADRAISASWAPMPATSDSASWASQSLSASYAPFTQTYQESGSWASASISTSYSEYANQSLSASWAPFTQVEQVSASWASSSISASYADKALSASWAPMPATSDSSSWASSSISSSHSVNSDNAISASWVPNLYPQVEQVSASWASQSFNAVSASWAPDQTVSVNSASWASSSISSSHSVNSDNAISASWAPNLYPQTEQVSASWASASLSASWAPMPVISNSSSWASSSISSSHALAADTAISASWAPMPTTSDSASWASSSISSSYSDNTLSASWAPIPTLVPSASWALTASSAVNSFNAVSASWAPDQTVTSSVALTASYFKSTLSASKAWHMYIDGNGNLITEFV